MATERVSGHCAVLDHPNDGISLRESFRYHPYWLQLGTDLPSLLACSRQMQNYLLLPCSLPPLPAFLFFPPFSRSFGGMKPLSGRWADGDRQCPPAPKANWERPEKDCGAAEWS